MKVGSIKEDINSEKRISLTPETTKKLVEKNFVEMAKEKTFHD